jgi:hypothetical protein
MPLDLFIGLVLAGLLFLAILSVAAIVEAVLDYFPTAHDLTILDPSVSRELERIAADKGSKPHKRFAYDRSTKKAVLVESNRIADELRGEDMITVAVQ